MTKLASKTFPILVTCLLASCGGPSDDIALIVDDDAIVDDSETGTDITNILYPNMLIFWQSHHTLVQET